jgi:hypothetical protein
MTERAKVQSPQNQQLSQQIDSPKLISTALDRIKTFTPQVNPQDVARGIARAAVNLASKSGDANIKNPDIMREIGERHDIPGLTYERYNQATQGAREGHCLSVSINGIKTFYFYDPKSNELLKLTNNIWERVKPNRNEALGKQITEEIVAGATLKGLTERSTVIGGAKTSEPELLQENATPGSTTNRGEESSGTGARESEQQKAMLAEIRETIGAAARLDRLTPEEQKFYATKERAIASIAKLLREGAGTDNYKKFVAQSGVDPESFLQKYEMLETVIKLENSALQDKDAVPASSGEIAFWHRHLVDDLIGNSFKDVPSQGQKLQTVLRKIHNSAGLTTALSARGLKIQAA